MSDPVVIPQSFICPLSCDIMEDPVQDREGNSYERKWIIEWLKQKNESPMTRSFLNESHLIPNRALKDAIEEFKKQNPNYRILSKPETKALPPPPPPLEPIHIPLEATAFISRNPDTEHANYTLIKLRNSPQSPSKRVPVHICCIVDVSGSMETEVSVKSESGREESDGLSRLDLVKHALNTIVHALKEYDSMTLITFHTTASVIFSGMQTLEGNKKLILDQIKELVPLQSTNIWAGLKLGLEVMGQSSNNQVKAIYLLTDGQPTTVPPRGHEYELDRFLKQHPSNCPINTFGFGYELDSQLLTNLSTIGNGVFSFIPDGSFLGTIFINALAMLFTTIAVKAKAIVNLQNGGQITTNLGQILFDQNRTIVFPNADAQSIEVQYVDPFNNQVESLNITGLIQEEFENVKAEIIFHRIRTEFASTLQDCVREKAGTKLQTFIEMYNRPEFTVDPKVESILKDASGQATEAFAKSQWFNKWGRHFVPSLANAHMYQLCNNFKDPGVQNYAGEHFEKLRDELNDIFLGLPAPTPSVRTFKGSRRGSAYSTNSSSSGPVNMTRYYNSRGVCFAGNCLVEMEDSTKSVKEIRVGDRVRLPNKGVAKVTHVVKTVFPECKTELVKFESGLHITPWHPIKVNSKWTFPITLKAPELTECKEVFSFALDKGHIMLINGVQCVSLGHGFKEEVVKHEYFGSSKILSDLDSMPADNDRVIVLSERNILREEQGGQITGITVY